MNAKSRSTRMLYINTAKEEVIVSVILNEEEIARTTFPGRPDLSKNLSVEVKKLLKKTKTSFKKLKEIRVFPGPGSFTGLRIGISFANALGFALGIPVYKADEAGKVTEKSKGAIFPEYGAEPRITKPNKPKF